MTLKTAVLEAIAERNDYDLEAIRRLENISVEQHKQRAIAEQMANYPSLIKKLADWVEEKRVTNVDIQLSRSDPMNKPHWVLDGSTAVLYVNTL